MPLGSAVLKSTTFFLSFVLVHYFILSVVRNRRTIENVTKLARRRHCGNGRVFHHRATNAIQHLRPRRPRFSPSSNSTGLLKLYRLGLIRAFGSSGHPIELGVVLAMAFPLGLALGVWLWPSLVDPDSPPRDRCHVDSLPHADPRPHRGRDSSYSGYARATSSACFRLPSRCSSWSSWRSQARSSTLKNAFFPEGGLIAEQSNYAAERDPLLGGGRISQLGPNLTEASRTPLLGQGFATRQTGFNNPLRNAPILDDQWLGLLLELGIVGVIGWAMLFVGSARRLGRAARRRAGPDGWLAAGLAASIVGFGVAMFTFDGFGFIQATFMFWILISLAGVSPTQ